MSRQRQASEGHLTELADLRPGDWQFSAVAGHPVPDPLRTVRLDGVVVLSYACPVSSPGCYGGRMHLGYPAAPAGGRAWDGSAAAPTVTGAFECGGGCGWRGGLRGGAFVR